MDPSGLGLHTRLVWAAFFVMLYASPFALLGLLASAPIRSLRQDPRLVVAFVASSALAATVLLDPGNFFRWLMD